MVVRTLIAGISNFVLRFNFFFFFFIFGRFSGKEECIVESNDVVLFLSTLHGG